MLNDYKARTMKRTVRISFLCETRSALILLRFRLHEGPIDSRRRDKRCPAGTRSKHMLSKRPIDRVNIVRRKRVTRLPAVEGKLGTWRTRPCTYGRNVHWLSLGVSF